MKRRPCRRSLFWNLQSFGEFAIRDVILRTDNRTYILFAFDFDMQDAETDVSQWKAVPSIAPDNRPASCGVAYCLYSCKSGRPSISTLQRLLCLPRSPDILSVFQLGGLIQSVGNHLHKMHEGGLWQRRKWHCLIVLVRPIQDIQSFLLNVGCDAMSCHSTLEVTGSRSCTAAEGNPKLSFGLSS